MLLKIKFKQLLYQVYYSIKGQSVKLNFLLLISGFSLGFLELIFGVSLFNFLKSYNIVFEGKEDLGLEFILGKYPTLEILFFGLLLYFVKFLINLLPMLISQEFVNKHSNELSKKVFENYKEVSKLSLADCNHIILNLIRQSCQFQSSVFLLISSVLSSLVIFSALFFISLKLTIVIFFLIISFGVFFRFIKNNNQFFIDQIYKNSKVFIEKFTLSFQNLIFLKIIGYNEEVSRSIKKINHKIKNLHFKHSFFQSLNSIFPPVIGLFLIVIIITTNKFFFQLQSLEVIPFIYLLIRVSASLSNISDNLSSILYTFPYFKEFSKKINYKEKSFDPCMNQAISFEAKELRLIVKNLSIGRDSILLKNINFSLSKRELLIIKGESGIGKSTFLNTLLGIIKKKSGTISWMGYEIDDFSPKQLRNVIAFSGSEPYLIKGTINENICLGNTKNIIPSLIKKAMNSSESNFLMNFKDGLETKLYDNGQGLSAGQKQRVSIMRALLFQPKLLIFDEATSNIDIATEKKIIMNIKNNYKNISFIIITHRDSLDKYATQILKF